MGSATVRRFVLVAAVLLLAPVWSRPLVVASAVVTHPEVGMATGGAAHAPAIRRHTAGGWWLHGPHEEQSRSLVVLAVLGLLSSLLRRVPWVTLASVASVSSSLVRRRHAIALRAPPPLLYR